MAIWIDQHAFILRPLFILTDSKEDILLFGVLVLGRSDHSRSIKSVGKSKQMKNVSASSENLGNEGSL